MLAVSEAEMASIRAETQTILELPVEVQRFTWVPDGLGGSSENWVTILTTKGGIREPSPGALQNYDFMVGALATWEVKLPYGIDIAYNDRIIITDATSASPGDQILMVKVVLAPRSYAALTTVLAVEVKLV